ncbi:MAG: FHA domain-containing protein [Tepidisphaeraceae bacterium]|jgi:hypothetical protein
MNQTDQQDAPGGIIRITSEDAYSPHVEDLLKRQASMRGEGGITRDRRRKWYFQNWFVFALAGLAGALGGWALLEPYFADMIYLQGKLTDIRHAEKVSWTHDGQQKQLQLQPVAEASVGGRPVVIVEQTRWIDAKGRYLDLDLSTLRAGQDIGCYVEYIPARGGMGLALFVTAGDKRLSDFELTAPLDRLVARSHAAGMLLFPVIAALIGLMIGAADGLMCRLWRRLLLGGAVGLLVGFIGGFISLLLAELVYHPLNALAIQQQGPTPGSLTTFGFLVQMTGRSLAWCLAGMAMGLAQGISLLSKRLLLYGFLGGLIGGLLGGLLFDPIDMLLLGALKPSAHWSRLVGFAVIGLAVGAMIGIVELLARDAWLRMVEGPLAGKEFLLFKDIMRIGSSPRSEIYLFNDPQVAAQHAILRSTGDIYELENTSGANPLTVNGRPVTRTRLRHGDRIVLGLTAFVFQQRRTE